MEERNTIDYFESEKINNKRFETLVNRWGLIAVRQEDLDLEIILPDGIAKTFREILQEPDQKTMTKIDSIRKYFHESKNKQKKGGDISI